MTILDRLKTVSFWAVILGMLTVGMAPDIAALFHWNVDNVTTVLRFLGIIATALGGHQSERLWGKDE